MSDPFGLCPQWLTGRPCSVATDAGAGFVPGLSSGIDAATVLSGQNPLTGEEVGLIGRGLALAGLLTPTSGGQIRGAGAVAKNWILPEVEKVVEAIKSIGAKVKVHPTKAGKGAAIDFGDGTVVDIRVETHPLSPGGPPKLHGNVETFQHGKQKSNKHIDP